MTPIRQHLVLATFIAALVCVATTIAAQKPNIVYMMADDLGPYDLSHAGQTHFTTPNIDRIAREGIQFRNMYSGNSWCAPSRAALMTGKHPGHASVRNNQYAGDSLTPGEATLATILKQAGYTTGVVGKWGIGFDPEPDAPQRFGFDEAFGYINMWHAHNYYPAFLWRNGQKVPLKNKVKPCKQNAYYPELTGWAYERHEYSEDLFAEEALKFIDGQTGPFFLYLPFIIPHENGEARYFNPDDTFEVPDLGRFADKPWSRNDKGKAAMIERMDNTVGQILDLLDRKGITNNTLVIFTSDNGGKAGNRFNSVGPYRGQKGTYYEGGLRVPFLLRWPARVKAGTTSDHLAAFWDVLPTFADIVNVSHPDSIDGISFLPALLGKEQAKHKHLYWEIAATSTYQQAVRWRHWKGFRRIDFAKRNDPASPPSFELYNLDEDPYEQKDIAAQHPEVVKQLKSIMHTTRSDMPGLELPDLR